MYTPLIYTFAPEGSELMATDSVDPLKIVAHPPKMIIAQAMNDNTVPVFVTSFMINSDKLRITE